MARILLDTDILSEIMKSKDAVVEARAAGLPIVTGNTGHFLAIREAGYSLMVENWRDTPTP
jgi:predicted nucleic acid-binding protein